MKTKVKVALDLDNTLFNSSLYVYNQAKRERINELSRMSFEEFISQKRGIEDRGGNIKTEKFLNRVWKSVHTKDQFNTINNAVLQLVIDLTAKLEEKNYDVEIDFVTARSKKYKDIFNRELFPKSIKFNKLVCSRKKHTLGYDIYIDDEETLIKKISGIDNAIMIKSVYPYNMGYESEFEIHNKILPSSYIDSIVNMVDKIKK